MRVQPPPPVSWRGNQPVPVAAGAGSEKPSNSATSGRQQRQAPQDHCREGARRTVEPVYRDGTKTHDPFRDGPRLMPAFVTQVLGQAMADGERPAPRLVYGTAPIRPALLLDTRL
jgi:hypothetical protein